MSEQKETQWTDEGLRVAIAKACGAKKRLFHCHNHWHWSFDAADEEIDVTEWGWRYYDHPGCCPHKTDGLPNYPSDLNACHEMENHIPSGSGGFDQYVHWLHKLCDLQESPYCAKARTRCFAFVKTLGLSP